jgi:di/tripeptidase
VYLSLTQPTHKEKTTSPLTERRNTTNEIRGRTDCCEELAGQTVKRNQLSRVIVALPSNLFKVCIVVQNMFAKSSKEGIFLSNMHSA